MASILSTAAQHVTTRHRSSSSAASLPRPGEPQHTNHPSPAHTHHHGNRPRSGSRPQSRPQSQHSPLSTSAPIANGPAPIHQLEQHQNFNHSVDTLGSSSSIDSQLPAETTLTIEFDGGTHVIVRPNRVVRGKVILDVAERMLVTRIRIKFRAEESAMVKVEEGGGDTRGEWIHQAITTFFESDWKLWGNEASYYSQCPWEEMDIGHYEFPFALKFPNVNYPPSMEDPAGFAIRYVWTAQADGPALQSGIKSREYITPYRPIIISTPDKEWTYRKTLMKDKKHAIAEVQAKLYKQSYCPDEPFEMQLNMTTLHADAKIAAIEYKFRKHHEGKMLVQQGTAFREHIRTVIHSTVPIPSSNTHHGTQVAETVIFDVPTRLVSPSFISRHTRVHYGLQFLVTIEQGHLFKNTTVVDFSIPIIIANLPHDNLLRIPDLTVIQGYRESKECPVFFDPSLDEPPSPSMNNGPLSTPMNEEPPNYYTLPIQPPQFQLGKERKERTVFLTRPAKGALHSQEMHPAVIIQGLFDEDW